MTSLNMDTKSSDPLAALWAELESGTPSATSKRAYFKGRARNALYNFVVRKFEERATRDGLTQKELALRMGKRPDAVSRWLASPGNWEIDTVAEFLLCIAGEELVPQSRSIVGRQPQNRRAEDLLKERPRADDTDKTMNLDMRDIRVEPRTA